jgi:hypothetical protein
MDFYKEPLAPGIVAFHNVLKDPQEFISDLEGLVEINNLAWVPGTTRDVNADGSTPNVVTTSVRDVEVISLPNFEKNPDLRAQGGTQVYVHNFLHENLYPVVTEYAREHGVISYANGEGWQLLKYGEGHHFGNHVDDNKMYPRTFSLSYYLNDDYEGGEIEFPRFGLKIKPVANQLIMFPANYVYNHIVHPVTSGTRYAVVNWFE